VALRPPRTLRSLCCLLLVAAACQACARAGPGACSSGELRLVTSGRLTAGVDLTNAPFAFTDSNTGTATGFEVDLLRAMAKAMELKLTVLNRTAPALIPAALAHRVDVAAATFRDDGGLPSDVCTSTPYLDGDLAMIVPSGSTDAPKTATDIAGRSVGVVRNSAAARWAAGHLTGSRVTSAETTDDLIADLRTGKVDVGLADRAVAFRAQMAIPQLRVAGTVSIGGHYVLTGAADTAVMAPVDTALATLKSNGTLDGLKKRWFGPGV
jgi:ABC-type amino acid transport substrate-binding protein